MYILPAKNNVSTQTQGTFTSLGDSQLSERATLFSAMLTGQIQGFQSGSAQTGTGTDPESLPAFNLADYYRLNILLNKYDLNLDELVSSGRTALMTAVNSVNMSTQDYSSTHDILRKYDLESSADTSGSNSDLNVVKARQLTVSQDEFEKVKQVMKKAGMSDEDINQIAQSVQSGTNWASMLSQIDSLAGKSGLENITGDEKSRLEMMFGKLGFSQDEITAMLKKLAAGQNQDVMNAMRQKLAGMSQDSGVSVTGDELALLTKAMNVNPEESASLKDFFAALNNGETNAKGLSSLLTLIDSADRNSSSAKAVDLATLRSSLESIYGSAQSKSEGDSIDKYAFRNTVNTMDSAIKLAHEFSERNARNSADGFLSGNNRDGGGGTGSSKSQDNQAASDFWSKIRTAADSTGTNMLGNLSGRLNDLQSASRSATQTASQSGTGRTAQAEILAQVESGILKNLGQGLRQLTLELTPDDLGKLNIVLQVKGNEVNAVIRADNAEAARVISENLAQLRQSLEQQGLKVSKLDVQTGTANDSFASQWQGSSQHNHTQERESRQMSWSRFRSMTTQGQNLVQDMHPGVEQAILAREGIDLFA